MLVKPKSSLREPVEKAFSRKLKPILIRCGLTVYTLPEWP